MHLCVWAIEVISVFSPRCFLGLSQSQSSVTGDKARLLPRQEEMELGSLKATHNCIYIVLEESAATLNSCVLSSVKCRACAASAVVLFRELSQ